MRTPQRYLCTLAVMAVVALASVAALNYHIDPLRIYTSKSVSLPLKFHSNPRWRSPSMIRQLTGENNAIIVGSSLAQIINPKEVEKQLHARETLQLSMEAATPYEEYLVVKFALESGKVRHVVWVIDESFISRGLNQNMHDSGFPDYIYTTSRWDDYKYLLSKTITNYTWQRVSKNYDSSQWLDDYVDIPSWWPRRKDSFYTYSTPANLAELKKAAATAYAPFQNMIAPPKSEDFVLKNIKQYIDTLARAHPEVKFHLVWPPYPTLHYITEGPPALNNVLMGLQYIVDLFQDTSNVYFYSFADAFHYTNDTRYYGDSIHYDTQVAQYLSKHLARPRHQLTQTTFTPYVQRIIANIKNYRCCIPESGGEKITEKHIKKNQ